MAHRRSSFWALRVNRLFSFLCLLVLLGACVPAASGERQPAPNPVKVHLPLISSAYDLASLARATYASLNSMLEPSTGLIHDRFDASLLDLFPQFASLRALPATDKSPAAALTAERCAGADCAHTGEYGLKITYAMPAGNYGSYNLNAVPDSRGFDARLAQYLELWVKGRQGGERFEVVLWSNCKGGFPNRPSSALLTATAAWQKLRIPLADYQGYANLSSLCRLSFGFNDSIHPGGTIYLDQVAFVDQNGGRIHLPLDEDTNVTNIGLYMSSVAGAAALGIETRPVALTRLGLTLSSLEALPKWHGFPQTHNYVVSRLPSKGDACISTVDSGNLAAGLIVVRQAFPELAQRAAKLLAAMEWDWLFDPSANQFYGCRYPDGSATPTWHYDLLAADSRLAYFIGIGSAKIPASSWETLNAAHESPRCVAPGLWHFEPGWDGGGLFMLGLPAIFIDETGSELQASFINLVRDQQCFAAAQGIPAWGWSAAAVPPYGAEYCGYGEDCDDLIVPHASLLAIDRVGLWEIENNLSQLETLNLRKKAADGITIYDYGFRDSLLWPARQIAEFYLSLDQGMLFLSLVNHQPPGRIRSWFCLDPIAQAAIKKIPGYTGSCK